MWNMNVILSIIVSYLIGSLSPGIIISRIMGTTDIREHGSHGTGATNVQRTLGTFPAIIVFVCDLLKAVFALWIVSLLLKTTYDDNYLIYAIAAIIGHIFPIYYKFRGGKGVATTFAVMLMVDWQSALIAFILFLVVAFTTRYISLGSILGIFTYTFMQIINHNQELIVFSSLITLIIVLTHRQNILRLLKGTENKFSLKRKE